MYMPTLEGVDSSMYDVCKPVTELWVYMHQQWTKYEPNFNPDGTSNMLFVQATSGLKTEQAGDPVYAELEFSEGDD
jgi:hypothetical protein